MKAVGIDLGGSGFRVGVYDIATGQRTGPLLSFQHRASLHPDDVLLQIGEALEGLGWNGPIGLGFPGAVVNNLIQTAPNLGRAWCEVDVEAALSPFHGGQFSMLNDADAAAEGERRFGASHGDHACVLTLTVGTGLGTTVHQKGVLVPNLEYGRLPHPSREGVLEEHLSGQVRQGVVRTLSGGTFFPRGPNSSRPRCSQRRDHRTLVHPHPSVDHPGRTREGHAGERCRARSHDHDAELDVPRCL